MKSKFLIIAMAIAVIATVFMGCTRADKTLDSTTSTTASTTMMSTTKNNDTTATTDRADNSTTGDNMVESKADQIGDDIGQGAKDVADGVGGAVDQAGNAVKDALD